MLASFGIVFVVRMLLVKIAELSSFTLSVFLLPSFASHFCLIAFLREEVLERGMVIIPDVVIQRWFGQTSGWSLKLSEFSSAVKTNVTGLGLKFVILV